MEWYNILIAIVGCLGGVGGFISIYNAKSNKTTIDIANLSKIIEEERTERQKVRSEYEEYKKTVDERIDKFKKEFEDMKTSNGKFIMAIYRAYKCSYTTTVDDCPIVQTLHTNGAWSLFQCDEREDEI
jgi:hypothetical protein